MQSTINGVFDPEEWELVVSHIHHPDNPTIRLADLLRNRRTGIYVMFSGTAYCSVPQRWARELARVK